MGRGKKCGCKDRSSWVVTTYKASLSPCNGYRRRPTAYSTVYCTSCRQAWRTIAAYVETLVKIFTAIGPAEAEPYKTPKRNA